MLIISYAHTSFASASTGVVLHACTELAIYPVIIPTIQRIVIVECGKALMLNF